MKISFVRGRCFATCWVHAPGIQRRTILIEAPNEPLHQKVDSWQMAQWYTLILNNIRNIFGWPHAFARSAILLIIGNLIICQRMFVCSGNQIHRKKACGRYNRKSDGCFAAINFPDQIWNDAKLMEMARKFIKWLYHRMDRICAEFGEIVLLLLNHSMMMEHF